MRLSPADAHVHSGTGDCQEKHRPNKMSPRNLTIIALGSFTLLSVAGCSMKEEIKRIEAVKQAQQASASARSTNLTGHQIFIRSCNTCHLSGKQGSGPSLVDMDDHFKTDEELAAFIRKGKGLMPGQPQSTLNDQELKNLIDYLRQLNLELKEQPHA